MKPDGRGSSVLRACVDSRSRAAPFSRNRRACARELRFLFLAPREAQRLRIASEPACCLFARALVRSCAALSPMPACASQALLCRLTASAYSGERRLVETRIRYPWRQVRAPEPRELCAPRPGKLSRAAHAEGSVLDVQRGVRARAEEVERVALDLKVRVARP
jgi:hypothetical protein